MIIRKLCVCKGNLLANKILLLLQHISNDSSRQAFSACIVSEVMEGMANVYICAPNLQIYIYPQRGRQHSFRKRVGGASEERPG